MDTFSLRNDNKALLERLQRAQQEIKEDLLQNKHGDPEVVYLPSQPMSSTLADRNSLHTSLRKSQMLLKQAKINLCSYKASSKPSRSTLKRRHASNKQTSRNNGLPVDINKENLSFELALQDIGNKRPIRCKDSTTSPKKGLLHSAAKVKFDLKSSLDEDDSKTTKGLLKIDRPLLGYDWIAGMMDVQTNQVGCVRSAQDTLYEMSDNYLEQISHFRSLNRQDCSGNIAPWKEPAFTPISTTKQVTTPDVADIHDMRIIDYTVNSRLFPVPVDGNEVKAGNTASPRYIRISVPKAIFATPYKYKPKGNCSFDSLALPNHCLPGHKYTTSHVNAPSQESPFLDLRASLQQEDMKSGMAGNKSTTQDFLNDSYTLQFKLLQLK